MSGLTDAEKRALQQALVVDRKTKVQELAEHARKVLQLDDRGTVYLQVPRGRLSDSHLLALQLTGRKLANLLEIVPDDCMTGDELAAATGIPYKPLTARLSELRKKGWVESPERGRYRIVFGAIDDLLEEVGRQT